MNVIFKLALASVMLWITLSVQAGQQQRQGDGIFGFRATVEGEQFEARFGRFVVRPRLGPERLPTGFLVEVSLRDISSGDLDRDAEMANSEWFDVAGYPLARFQADQVAVTPRGGYVAKGELSLKGVKRSIAVPFSWRLTPRGIQMTGEVVLDRRWFGVGPQDDSSVAAPVTVFFDLAWGPDGV